jgi:general secretion pathway protein K
MMAARNNNRGIALILTLLVVTVLVALILEFNYAVRVDMRLAENYYDSTRAYYLAESGINIGRVYLKKDDVRNIDDLSEEWANIDEISGGDGIIKITIIDENSKINVNNLVRADDSGNVMVSEPTRKMLVRLLEILGVAEPNAEDIVSVIIDWIDPDDNEEGFGFEENAKNAPIDDLSELLLIHPAITRELLYGSKRSGERSGDSWGDLEEDKPGLVDFLTVGTVGPDSNSDSRININTASETVLMSLSDSIHESTARDIIEERTGKEGPFKDFIYIKNIMGEEDFGGMQSLLALKSNSFKIISEGQYGRAKKTLEAVFSRTEGLLSWKIRY